MFTSGCDSLAPSSEENSTEPAGAASERMKAPVEWSLLDPESRPGTALLGTKQSNEKQEGDDQPRFICEGRISTPQEAASASQNPWRGFRLQLHFSKDVVRAAENRTRTRLVKVTLPVRTIGSLTERKILLQARCRIPASEEAEQRLRRTTAIVQKELRERFAPRSEEQTQAQDSQSLQSTDATASSSSSLPTAGGTVNSGSLVYDKNYVCPDGEKLVYVGKTPVYIENGDHGKTVEADTYTCVREDENADDDNDGSGGGSGGDGQEAPPSCHDMTSNQIPDARDRRFLRAMEDRGDLARMWSNSNPRAAQADRREQGGYGTRFNGQYSFTPHHEVEDDITYHPTEIEGISPLLAPRHTKAWIHTHPFYHGEVIQADEIIARRSQGKYSTYEEYKAANPNEELTANNTNLKDNPKDIGLLETMGSGVRGYILGPTVIYSYEKSFGQPVKRFGPYPRCGY